MAPLGLEPIHAGARKCHYGPCLRLLPDLLVDLKLVQVSRLTSARRARTQYTVLLYRPTGYVQYSMVS